MPDVCDDRITLFRNSAVAELVSLLEQNHCLVERTDGTFQTALHHAVRRGDPNLISLLLRYGAPPNSLDRYGQSPLFRISEAFRCNPSTWRECLKYLLDAGSDPGLSDHNGRTPLHIAASLDLGEVVRTLASLTPDIDIPDNNGQTPLRYAVTANAHHAAIELLRSSAKPYVADRNNITPASEATENGDAIMKRLVADGRRIMRTRPR